MDIDREIEKLQAEVLRLNKKIIALSTTKERIERATMPRPSDIEYR